MIKNVFKLFIIVTLSLSLAQCSTYNVKKDVNKNGELTKTPKWYVKYNREDKKWIYETATSVSPDHELSVKFQHLDFLKHFLLFSKTQFHKRGRDSQEVRQAVHIYFLYFD